MKKTIILSALLSVLSSNLFAKDLFTIFTYPPSNKIDWSTPRSTLQSLFFTEGQKTIMPSGKEIISVDTWGEETSIDENYRADIGHSITHISCNLKNGELFERWSSVSGEEYTEIDIENMFKNQSGMGLFFHEYIDGHVISGEENINLLIYYHGVDNKKTKVNPRYLQYEITTDQCESMVKMIKFYEVFHYSEDLELSELKDRDKNEVLLFSTKLDPYLSYKKRLESEDEKVGGNCASYAFGLLKMASLYDEELDPQVKLQFDISERLIGSFEKPVSLSSLLFNSVGKKWTHKGFENRRLESFDPQKIWDFSSELRNCISNTECKLKELSWYKKNSAQIEPGQAITLTSKDGLKSVLIDGVLIKSTAK
jgi:hypothetical protein